jgi:hypothetical protein
MPHRSLSQRSFFDPEFVQPDCLVPGTVPWLLGRFRSTLFPCWLFAGWRGEGRLGRDAWPAVTLLTLLFLRWSEEGISRMGSTRRAKTDTAWRAAMGLHLQTQVPNEKTLREFEAFMRGRHPGCGVPRFLLLHEHIVRVCIEEGVVGKQAVWTMDSTPMWCYGAVMDTIRLLGDGTRMLAQRWAKATGQSIEQVADQWKVPYVLAKSIKGHFSIDWRDPNQRAQVVEAVASGALRAVEHVRGQIENAPNNRRKRLLRRCRDIVRVVEQDLETDKQGRLVIARKVAKDRIVSLTDPCARHGRKSKSKTFNGFKVHVLGDVVSGLIAAVTVTAGNRHDGSVAHRLIRRAKHLHAAIDVVLGDTAYGGATLCHRVSRELSVKLTAPPPPVTTPTRPNAFRREDFALDFKAHTATCPAGVTTDDRLWVWSNDHRCHTSAFRWPRQSCNSCHLRQRCCGNRQGGQHLRLHPHEQQLRQAREDWQDPEFRKLYRRRSECERLVNQMTRHGARQARGWGLGSAQLQAHLIAMRCNLQLLARALAQRQQAERNAS